MERTAIFTGDIASTTGRLGFINGPGFDLPEWKTSIKRLIAEKPDRIYPGHNTFMLSGATDDLKLTDAKDERSVDDDSDERWLNWRNQPDKSYSSPLPRRTPIVAVKSGISHKKIVIIAGRCTVEYEGRASSSLGSGERLVILKPDGSALVHRPKDYSPVNWQPPGSLFQTQLRKRRSINQGLTGGRTTR